MNPEQSSYWIIGRLARALAVARDANIMEELPPIGALVIESSHSWRHRGMEWPQPEGIGWVEQIDPEDEGRPLDRYNSRVVIRRLDDDTLQPWVNAGFIVVPIDVLQRPDEERSS